MPAMVAPLPSEASDDVVETTLKIKCRRPDWMALWSVMTAMVAQTTKREVTLRRMLTITLSRGQLRAYQTGTQTSCVRLARTEVRRQSAVLGRTHRPSPTRHCTPM